MMDKYKILDLIVNATGGLMPAHKEAILDILDMALKGTKSGLQVEIDWEGWNWAAVDRNGAIYLYDREPSKNEDDGCWAIDGPYTRAKVVNWESTLARNPHDGTS